MARCVDGEQFGDDTLLLLTYGCCAGMLAILPARVVPSEGMGRYAETDKGSPIDVFAVVARLEETLA